VGAFEGSQIIFPVFLIEINVKPGGLGPAPQVQITKCGGFQDCDEDAAGQAALIKYRR
jgi:hypothetical protein